jgi:hypothetical protein
LYLANPTRIKNNKLYQPIVFSVKLIIFALAIYYLYNQFSQRNLENLGSFISKHLLTTRGFLLLGVLILIQFVNYGLENLKWRKVLDDLKTYSFGETQKAVYAGNAVAILTPDRLGTFIGRFSYLKDISKTKITFSTFVGNYAQLVTTLLFSLLGLVLSWNFSIGFQFPEQLSIKLLISIMVVVCCGALSIYYHQRTLVEILRKRKWKFMQKLVEKLEFMEQLTEKRLHIILLIALARYFVFVIQFYIALQLFGLTESFIWTLSFCGILYLFSTIIPSPFMGNLGTREAIGVFLVAPLGLSETIVAASLFVWLTNVVLPSLLGGLILLKK